MYFVLLKPQNFVIKHESKLYRANLVPDACEFWVQIPRSTRKNVWQNILKYFCPVEHFLGTRNKHSNLQKSQNHTGLNVKGSWGKWGLSWIPPYPLCLLIWSSQEKWRFLNLNSGGFGVFSACLPLSNSLEMFHEDVGMKSATSEEFTPGRGKEKNHEMLLIHGSYIIRNQVAVIGIKWFDAVCWQAEPSGQQEQPRGKRQRGQGWGLFGNADPCEGSC